MRTIMCVIVVLTVIKANRQKKAKATKKKYSTASSKLKNLKIAVKKKLENYSEKKT